MRDAPALRALLPAMLLGGAIAPPALAQDGQAEMLAELRQMRARLDEQAAEIQALKAKLDAQSTTAVTANETSPQPAAPEPATRTAVPPTADRHTAMQFKGAPEFRDGDWRFRVRGRVMYDVGHVGNPNNAIATSNLGFNSRLRRARLGVEGDMPGNFSYKAEADFASNQVEWADVYLEWEPVEDFSLRVGHHNSFQSLEQPTSSLDITFLERAQFTEAYSQARRLGGSAIFSNEKVYFAAGLFNEGVNGNYNNDGWLVAARTAFMPKLGDAQLHLAANFQHRAYNSSNLGARYRARPNGRFSDISFIDTGTIAADRDSQLGLEAFAILGRWHLGGEASWLWVDAITADDIRPGDDIPAGAVIASGDPGFFGYYLEAGYFFTGETRGYRKSAATWHRTKVKNPLGQGGVGAVSANVRWDSMNLNDRAIQSGGVHTSSSRGGRNNALSVNIIWQPIDFVRISTQYTLMNVKGGPYALQVNGLPSGDATDESYRVNVFGTRFAFDF